MKNEKGITLVSLVVTIVVLAILLGIEAGITPLIKQNTNTSKDEILVTELAQVQQKVFEKYIEYENTGNETILKGIKLEYNEARSQILDVDNSINLLQTEYDINTASAEKVYYKLTDVDLKSIGMSNVKSNREYIVNYETGEVIDTKNKKTKGGEILYVSK